MKKAKRILCMILAAASLLSLTACGAKQTEAQPKETAAAASVSEETPDPLGRYAETVTVHTVASSNANCKFPEGCDWNNNPFLDLIKEELNIEVVFDWVADGSQYENKLATMMVSGKLPDFFIVMGNDYFDLASQDAVMDLAEVHEKYASPLMREKEAAFREGFDSAYFDGKLYGIPRLGYGSLNSALFWIRRDWLEKCGMEVPTTMDELHDVAKAFMEKCGASYGISFSKTLTDNKMNTAIPFANAFHSYPCHWFKKDGQITYGSIQPEMKNTLQMLQNWYKEGIIDPEFSVKDDTKCREGFASGKCGIMTGLNWMGAQFQDSAKNDPNADWIAMEIPAVDDVPITYQATWPVNGYYVVNKDCEHPEAMLKIMNLYVKVFDEGYIEECKMKWGLNKDSWPAYQTSPLTDYIANVEILEAMETGDESKLSPGSVNHYHGMKAWMDDHNFEGYMRYLQHTSAYPILRPLLDSGRVQLDELHGMMPKSYIKVKGTLDQMENETFVKIIMGDDIDTFDTFVTTWRSMGGDTAIAEANAMFAK